jgi:hypothetical protein
MAGENYINFLTQGTPQVNTSSTLTTSQVPQYLSDYLYKLMSGAYSAASEEYQPYAPLEGEDPKKYERIAGFDPLQTKAFDQITGTFDPVTGKQITPGAADAYKTNLANAGVTATSAAGMSPTAAASTYFKDASELTPSNIGTYLNPYQENVTDRMGEIAERQVREKLLPGLSDTFTRSGQYGSTRHQELANRGVRDIASELQGNIGVQLAKGYDSAAAQKAKDLERIASIGQVSGTLTGTEMQQKGALASIQAGLGQKEQALGLQGAAAIEAVGAEKQGMEQRKDDLRYADFTKQTDFPKEQISYLSDIIRGLPSGAGGSTTASTTTGSGNSYSASPLAQLASAGLSAAAISNLLK